MITLRICETKVTLQFGFFAVPALVLCLGGGAYFLPSMLACAVHEAGHIVMAKLCGVRIREISFGMLGIHMAGELHSVSYLKRTAVSLAGPLAGFLGFFLLLPLPEAYSAMQLILFVFHILPAVPLDGGMALYCALCCVMQKEKAERWSIAFSVVLAFLLGSLGFSVLLRTKGNFTLLAAAAYIFVYILIKQRDDLC